MAFKLAASDETKQVLAEAMEEVKSAVPSHLYRCFLKVMKFAVDCLLTEFNVTGRALRSLNSLEMNFCAVEAETPLVCHLVYLLGYEEVDEPFYEPRRHKFAMVDVRSSKCALEAFQVLAMEEISQSSTSSVADLTSIENVPLIVAHLAYNLHLRLEPIGLSTARTMMGIMEEDVVAAIACIDYLAFRLGVMADDSNTLVVWNLAKEMMTEYMSSGGSSCSEVEVRQILKEVATRLSVELSFKVSTELVHVLLFTNCVEKIARLTRCGELPNSENIHSYERSFNALPRGFLSDKFCLSCDSVVKAMTRALECQLSSEVIEQIYRLVVWQSRHFIYHVRSEVVQMHNVGSQLHGVIGQDSVDSRVLEEMLATFQSSYSPVISVSSVAEVVTNNDEEKHTEDMNEKEKADNESEVDDEPFIENKLQNIATCDRNTVESCGELDDSHISILERQVDYSFSFGQLRHIEIEIDRLCEKSRFRKSGLKRDMEQLKNALSCTSDLVVVEALREELTKSTNEYEVDSQLTARLEMVKSKLNLKQQTLRSHATLRCLSCEELRQHLRELVCRCRQQHVGSNVELVVTVLPLFTDDEITLLCKKLALDLRISESDFDTMHKGKASAVTELLAYFK